MKLTLTFEHEGKRHNVAVKLDGLPSKGDAFTFPIKRIDPFQKSIEHIKLTLVVWKIDIDLYNVQNSLFDNEFKDFTADVSEIVVHCNVIPQVM